MFLAFFFSILSLIFRIIFTINYFPDRIPISSSLFLFFQVFTLLLDLLHIFFSSHFFLSFFFFFFFLGGWDGVPVLQVFWPEVSSTCV